jgi:hypothetical protein
MLRYRLYDIDRLINRTVVYGLLTALLGGGYAGLVLMLGQLFGRSSSLAVAAATLTIAAAFQPARRRIQAAVDRRFNRRRYDAARTIAAFSARLREEIDLDSLSAELLGVVDQTMEPTNATLWLRPSPDRMVEPLNRPAAGSTARTRFAGVCETACYRNNVLRKPESARLAAVCDRAAPAVGEVSWARTSCRRQTWPHSSRPSWASTRTRSGCLLSRRVGGCRDECHGGRRGACNG